MIIKCNCGGQRLSLIPCQLPNRNDWIIVVVPHAACDLNTECDCPDYDEISHLDVGAVSSRPDAYIAIREMYSASCWRLRQGCTHLRANEIAHEYACNLEWI